MEEVLGAAILEEARGAAILEEARGDGHIGRRTWMRPY